MESPETLENIEEFVSDCCYGPVSHIDGHRCGMCHNQCMMIDRTIVELLRALALQLEGAGASVPKGP